MEHQTFESEGNGKVSSIPPYVPFKTLSNFLDGLKSHMPSRIDRSVMTSMSGALQGQLTSALRYLQLVSTNGAPTDRLTKLANAEGPEKQKAWQNLITATYPFLFKGFDLERATSKQLEEQFSATGAGGATIGKCMAFFLAAAKAADIKLSPHVKPFKSVTRTTRARRNYSNGAQSPANGEFIPAVSQPEATVTWEQMLLSKFPSFDPTWPDDVKTKWFAAFDQLMKQGSKGKEKHHD
jgi:hypothetical protein